MSKRTKNSYSWYHANHMYLWPRWRWTCWVWGRLRWGWRWSSWRRSPGGPGRGASSGTPTGTLGPAPPTHHHHRHHLIIIIMSWSPWWPPPRCRCPWGSAGRGWRPPAPARGGCHTPVASVPAFLWPRKRLLNWNMSNWKLLKVS